MNRIGIPRQSSAAYYRTAGRCIEADIWELPSNGILLADKSKIAAT
jgi:hypothetical protein